MRLDAIVFDLGNTLVPWGARETKLLYGALQPSFEETCGPMPDFFDRAVRARDTLIEERAASSMREITIEDFAGRVCGRPAPAALLDAIGQATLGAFREICRVPEALPGLLKRLGRHHRLAVLSNFYMTEPIEQVLKQSGLWDCFVHVEVSATSGFAKPHPAPFEAVRKRLGVSMERTLMVGDEFWADIVGGHRAGFRTALTHEHRRGPTGDARAPGIRADRVLARLEELS